MARLLRAQTEEGGVSKKAIFVRDIVGWRGEAKLFRCEPPLEYEDYGDEQKQQTEYVIVSAVNAMFTGPETYIFPANAEGEITDWSELDGSYRGGHGHAEALENAGYSVEYEPA
jgi:hypothetical protein